jgi:dCMP deaminase
MILKKYQEFIDSNICDNCGSQRCDRSPVWVAGCDKYKRFVLCDNIIDDLESRQRDKTPARISKDEYYLNIAEAVLQRSTCLRRKYGAVIVQNDVIVATGYNGSPRGMKNCCDTGLCEREKHNVPKCERYELCVAIHAEDNAISAAGRDKCLGSTLYICGIETDGSYAKPDPCLMCNRKIINSGIKKVIGRGVDGQAVDIPLIFG